MVLSVNQKMKKGFTLIELLVVISIISLLSSVALATLRGARDKAADASLQQGLGSVRIAGLMYYDDTRTDLIGTYGDQSYAPHGCVAIMSETNVFSHPPVKTAIEAALAVSGSDGICYRGESPTSWVLAIPTKGTYGSYDGWCVDSLANAKFVVMSNLMGALPTDGSAATCDTSI